MGWHILRGTLGGTVILDVDVVEEASVEDIVSRLVAAYQGIKDRACQLHGIAPNDRQRLQAIELAEHVRIGFQGGYYCRRNVIGVSIELHGLTLRGDCRDGGGGKWQQGRQQSR